MILVKKPGLDDYELPEKAISFFFGAEIARLWMPCADACAVGNDGMSVASTDVCLHAICHRSLLKSTQFAPSVRSSL